MTQGLGKDVEWPIKIIELDSPDEFETILKGDLSYYEGHDDTRYYASSNLEGRSVSREVIYQIKKDKMSADRLKAALQYKKERNYQEMRQMPIIEGYEEWLARTKPVDAESP